MIFAVNSSSVRQWYFCVVIKPVFMPASKQRNLNDRIPHVLLYSREIRHLEAEEGIQMICSITARVFLCVLGLYK